MACTCWGYPSKGWKHKDKSCNTTDLNQGVDCGLPHTHYPIKGTALNTKPRVVILNNTDNYNCKTSIYPAPLELAWGCSDGKFYSYLTLEYHAGLKCGVGIPSLCPSRVFKFSAPTKRACREVEPPKERPGWAVHGVSIPDYYIVGQTVSLMFENIFTPYVTFKRHQFVLENITWQLHLLSNRTRLLEN